MKGFVFAIALAGFFALSAGLVRAEDSPFRDTDLPLPRYVTLASDEVNVRAGPGLRYPIEWVYRKKSLPVEIVREFEHWREIRDFEGQTGWVHKSMLSGQRGILVTGTQRVLYKAPAGDAPPVAQVEAGVVGILSKCKDGWCKVEVSGYDGWIKIGEFWGVNPGEEVN